MTTEHHYSLTVDGTGNLGPGTATYRGYSRDRLSWVNRGGGAG